MKTTSALARVLILVFGVLAIHGVGATEPSPRDDVEHSDVARSDATQTDEQSCIPADQCCKICDTGKACGNSCISRKYNCHKGRGCACNADEICE